MTTPPNKPACSIQPSSLFCHHILLPPHPTPFSCLLSSFIHPASPHLLGSLSVYCTQKQTALLILMSNVAHGGHFASSSVHFHRPQLRKSLEHDQVEPAHTPEGNTGGREGKVLRFPWGTSLLWVTGEADTLQLSSPQDWGPPFHKSSRSKCSKPFVSSLSHLLPCTET